ncbi:adenosine deaminase [Aestuariibacter sp. AA17]|uniref:adenosine deaminase n=1 Tax=Fluctibacter corallii TaxID=2984329 RepID=A0ABT3A5W6_9ALTE|nr:adenosine deaminase [Aestuariibacter sp. AA17]MCV2884033.1 adenosine deaminase [Aestuariibacter sp. AA17]
MIDYNLPVVDLHRHLDGNIKPQLIRQLAEKYNLPLSDNDQQQLLDMESVSGQLADLVAFLSKLDLGVSMLSTPEACYDVAYANVQDAYSEKLDYVELRFSPHYMANSHGLSMYDVIESVIAGVKDGMKAYPVRVNLIGILSRTNGVNVCMEELKALLHYGAAFCGLDLAGDEVRYPAELFASHFAKGRDAGWKITVHAGEASGPDSIWQAINILGATRIGHGVAAIHDPALMDYMLEHNIAIESCPTSNFQTAAVPALSSHPLPDFVKRGLLVTLNTDDPGVSAIDLAHEYQLARDTFGFTQATLAEIQRNAVNAAFLSETDKQRLFRKTHIHQAV